MKLTESDLDLAIAKQTLEHCNGKPLPVGLDQQGRYATRTYKPSEHYVDPAWSGSECAEQDDPPTPRGQWYGVILVVLSALCTAAIAGWVATL